MRARTPLLVPVLLACAGFSTAAFADKDDRGHGHRKHGGHEYKEEYWDGNCKVKRKLEKDGDYKEERKCKAVHHHQRPVVVLSLIHI